MPHMGRIVGPTRICQIGHITGPVPNELSSTQNTHNLEETTYIALVGLMKQLCDIATYADEVFVNLHNIAKKTVERTDKLHKKVSHLCECLNDCSEFDDEDPRYGPGTISKNQSLFNRDSRPSNIKERYETAEITPPLHEFLDFMTVDDRTTQPHKLYSDPSLFFNAWVSLMEKESQQFKKARKRSFKKMKGEQYSKIATLKKKVHDPKSKTYIMVDVEPQYATLRGKQIAPEMPVSATLNRKKYGPPKETSGDESETTANSDSYLSPVRAASFNDNRYRQCSTPIASPPEQPDVQLQSTSDIDLSVTSTTSENISLPSGSCLNTSLPPPPSYDLAVLPIPPLPQDLPLPSPPPASPPPAPSIPSAPSAPVLPDNTPPPFMPPPVPDIAIKPTPLTEAQRILRTNAVPQTRGRETLLEMIRSSSFNLKPVALKPMAKQSASEPTYATFVGRDVASILQRRKYLMGAGEHSDYSSASDSDDGCWD